eukprot:GHVN01054497.1.p1 GENE.GHVN01054497.1~~GHVN01054497.1.p1  ORF type:complete len:127 (-),score=14.69 GHVN01054497.1:145-525(-)
MVDQRRKEYVEALKTKDKKKVEDFFGQIHCPMDGCHSSPFDDSLWKAAVTADTVQKWSDVKWQMINERSSIQKEEAQRVREAGQEKEAQEQEAKLNKEFPLREFTIKLFSAHRVTGRPFSRCFRFS